MLQRNTTDYPAFVGGASIRVEPGEVIDHDDPITGFEPVADEPAAPPPPAPAPAPAPASAPEATSDDAADPTTTATAEEPTP